MSDMVIAGRESGLKTIGIADHGPHNIGTGVRDEGVFVTIKDELAQLQINNPELQLFAGAEADVISLQGDLDITPRIIKELDYLIIGLHPFVWPRGLKGLGWLLENQLAHLFSGLGSRVKNSNTKALVEAIYKYDVWAVSHPGLKMPIDISETARACIKRNTAWEINTGHKFPSYQQVLEAARSGVDFVVNSDAHFPDSVGCLEYGSWVLEKCRVGADRVLNAKQEQLEEDKYGSH